MIPCELIINVQSPMLKTIKFGSNVYFMLKKQLSEITD
jgi:hypothetical protein